MKFLSIPILFILLSTILWQCQRKHNKVNFSKPESVAVAFVRAGSALDFMEAAQYVEEDLKEVFEAAQSMAADIPAEEKEKAKKNSRLAKKADCVVKGNLAECIICCDAEGNKSPQAIQLKKIEGRWLVYMNKEDRDPQPNY
jgi:hypothetical protein